MAPIDAKTTLLTPKEATKLIEALSMALILLLHTEENMTVSFAAKFIESFPFDCFQFSMVEDPMTDSTTFMLISTDDCEKAH